MTTPTGPLSEADLAYLRSELGDAFDENLADDAWLRLGTVKGVALELVRLRLASVLAGPDSYAISGVYSESTGKASMIQSLQLQLQRIAAAGDPAGAVTVGDLVRITTKPRAARR